MTAARDIAPLGQVLLSELGARVLNYIMTPATFANLSAVCADLVSVASDARAWEGHAVHLEYAYVPAAALDRMTPTWRLLKILYLSGVQVAILESRVLCPVAWIWTFDGPFGNPGVPINPGTNPYVFASFDAIPAGVRVEFEMSFGGLMPIFDVGWSSEDNLEILLDSLNREQEIGGRFVRFRVARRDSFLAPAADRGHWINERAMSDLAAIRLPDNWTRCPHNARITLRIGLEWTAASVCVYINDRRWVAALPDEGHRIVQFPTLLVSNGLDFEDLMLTTLPLSPRSGRHLDLTAD